MGPLGRLILLLKSTFGGHGEITMEELGTTLFSLLVGWGVVTTVLICMLIYRSMLGAHEDDQIFLDKAGDSMAQEQRLIVARIERLGTPIKLLFTASIVLLLVIAGMWLWRGYTNF
jgi:hypothetical protein